MPANLNPHDAAIFIRELADKKWTTAEQRAFFDALGRLEWVGAYLTEYRDVGYEEGYKFGDDELSNALDDKDTAEADCAAWKKTAENLEKHNAKLEKINAALDVKLAELERNKP